MQIRLTVTLGARGSGQGAVGATGVATGVEGAGAASDVVVTAPSGTPLSAVTGALASAAASAGGAPGAGGGAESAADSAAVYVGTERLDPHRQVLGEPPLLDGAVVSLHGPALPATPPALAAYGSAKARLHVIAGPDAGGIHLLQGGKVHLGRSAETDVPLDDPDVSRLHCAVTVTDGGAVTVTDLGSTNGTSLDGAPVGPQPVLFRPGSTLRVGESALRLETRPVPAVAPAAAPALSAPPSTLSTLPDGNGQLRLVVPPEDFAGRTRAGHREDAAEVTSTGGVAGALPEPRTDPASSADGSHSYAQGGPFRDDGSTHGAGFAQHAQHARTARHAGQFAAEQPPAGTPTGRSRETERTRARGLGAWARRFAGARTDDEAGPGVLPGTDDAGSPHGLDGAPVAISDLATAAGAPVAAAIWKQRRPDPATVLLTALGPGPRLWEREPGHPDALTVRIGTAHRTGGRPGEPVTVDLRESGALGLAGPRPRLMGLARSVVAQLAALHGPSTLEIVLLAADRSRGAAVRTAEWAWLGWLPHLRPVHGQDCRLLTAYDRDQATTRTAELSQRLDEERRTARAPGSDGARTAAGHSGPYTLLVVDGDPGSAALREAVTRLAAEGPGAGIHVLCLAETPAATPASPLSETVEAAYATSSAFRECGALAMLSGAVATAVRVVRRDTAGPGTDAADPAGTAGAAVGSPVAGDTVATVDAVSAAWSERFARAIAPLREPEGTAARTGGRDRTARPAVTLPRTSRLLDELGLARATPAALLARWAGPEESAAGRATLVFGAGPRGPMEAQLTSARGHALVTGPAGSGKTELLRSLAASLSAGERPDRLRLVLLDGDGTTAREGLRSCLELPHARRHLAMGDPVHMREFAQSLSRELKRRAELIGAEGSYEEFARDATVPAHRVVSPRQPSDSDPARPARDRAAAQAAGSGDRRGSGQQPVGTADAAAGDAHGTLRLGTLQAQPPSGGGAPPSAEPGAGTVAGVERVPGAGQPPGAAGSASATEAGSPGSPGGPLPRLVFLVDDLDTLVDPALGNPGRPAAGSVVRALEAVARDGARLGMHLVAVSGRPECTDGTAVAHAAALRAELTGAGADGVSSADSIPGRGTLIASADGSVTAFQAGRVTGRIPRTSTQRPTVVPLDWTRAGDPPTRRPVRELGNGPTDLALLASAIDRAAQSLGLDPQETGTHSATRSRSGQDDALES